MHPRALFASLLSAAARMPCALVRRGAHVATTVLPLAAVLVPLTLGTPAKAASWDTVGTPFATAGSKPELSLHGDFRMRGDVLHNFDMDRGPTPSGQLLYPAPTDDVAAGNTLTRADLRLRLRPRVLYKSFAIKATIDVLDDLQLGSTPAAALASSVVTGQISPETVGDAFAVRHVWAEVALPIGLLAVGRMPNQFGLGLIANDGRCAECQGADASDRIAFITPLLGHLWGVGYDFSASGPQRDVPSGTVDATPADDVRSLSAVVMRTHTPIALDRKVRAGRWVPNYGLLGSVRTQDKESLPLGAGRTVVQPRGFFGAVVDGWFRLRGPGWRIEAEAAWLYARIEDTSLIPGVSLDVPSVSQQWGGMVEIDRTWPGLTVGLDLGVASGDPAPGFGANPGPSTGQPGDLEGAQVAPPGDLAVDNFRFHPNVFVDRILWRQVIGRFTDGAFARARVAYTPVRGLELGLWAVASAALYAQSTPGHPDVSPAAGLSPTPLGIELDPSITFTSPDGYAFMLASGTLFPLAGLAQPGTGLAAPAHTLRMTARFAF